MKLIALSPLVFAATLILAPGCSGDDGETGDDSSTEGDGDAGSGGTENAGDGDMSSSGGTDSGSDEVIEAPAINIPSFDSGLGGDTVIATLSDEEIVGACEKLNEVVTTADAEAACRVVAASENDDENACNQQVIDCLEDPESALAKTSIRSTPAPIDCGQFSAELTAGCEFPLSLLEDCVDALAVSVVPQAEAVSCDKAADFTSIEQTEEEVQLLEDTGYVQTCIELYACTDLVTTLLGGS